MQLYAGNDSLFCRKPEPSKNRIVLVSSAGAGIAAGSLGGLATVWYKEDLSSFTFFNDNKEWKQMDKAGHLATTYNVSLIIADAYRWSGVSDKKSRLIGSTSSLLYMTVIEVMDGFSAGYGFSYGDMIFNSLGAAGAYCRLPGKDRYYPSVKYSYHKTSFSELNPDLLGSSYPEKFLKDYNAQTYWLSLPGIIKKAPWACISFGYGATNMVRARDEQNLALGLEPSRNYLLSLDVDLTRIRTRSCFVNGLFSVFRFVKIPFPALGYSKNRFSFHPMYF